MKRTFASLLVVAAGLLLALARWLGPADVVRPSAPPQADRPTAGPPAPSRDADPAAASTARPGELASTGEASRDAQIARVVAAMDETGRPPEGVAQGGRRGGAKGLFDNREGRLPARGRGYYVESDVWPRGPGGRGTYRLIFGREREVYYTADHYRTFTRLR